MKKLTRIRLINWHRFLNETIEFDESVLLSGENGAGKSTLLDALQFVVTCSKNNFNKAAHEKGKRSLNSYMRCKTGREDKPFERTGEISSHIALEFFDESKRQSFIVGAVMDSATEDKEPDVIWYQIENRELSDELFLIGTQVKSISVFRQTNECIRNWSKTQAEGRRMMLARFGRLEDKFLSLIPKALAFKPISDIKDFVYSYVLDEKEVNIDSLRENVRSYQDLERLLADVKQRITELEGITEKYNDFERFLKLDRKYDYYLARADVELSELEAENTSERLNRATLRQQELSSNRRGLRQSMTELNEAITSLMAELKGDSAYQALHELERTRDRLLEELSVDEANLEELLRDAKEALRAAENLIELGRANQTVEEYKSFLTSLKDCQQLSEVSLCLDKTIAYKNHATKQALSESSELNHALRLKSGEQNELRAKISQLEKKQLSYPREVSLLQQRIKEQLREIGRSGEVRVLCELLEVLNPSWQNAVEGYLNNQRFYLIVEPEDFDVALSVYDRLREGKKVYGVGLINTAKLEEFDKAPEGSLASMVGSKSIWAKRYINMILGRVHCANSYQELKNYPIAITRQCMRYQNHVVSAIRPEVYQTPYIGAEAYKRQLEQCKQREAILEAEITDLQGQIKTLEQALLAMETGADLNVKYKLFSIESQRSHSQQLSSCMEQIKKLEENQTLILKQLQLRQMQAQRDQIEEQIASLDKEMGRCDEERAGCERRIAQLGEERSYLQAELVQVVEMLGSEADEYRQDYEKDSAKQSGNIARFKENYTQTKVGNLTRRDKALEAMTELMHVYKGAHDFGAAATAQGYEEFLAEYEKLKNSQLLSYEEKVQRARAAAEDEFREQFLSRLQENIKQAQNEFKELNRSLMDIHFSRERYEFLHGPNKRLKKYYEMIMSDFNIMGGESLFSGKFRDAHREVIEELFEKLTVEDENSTKVLEEFTDYRTYLDYDIKIINDDDSYMLYSKVSQEKSGGETQTPFYITVAASFMQLYRNSIGGDSIGLIMLDEAFNNMDDERIQGMLEFLTSSKLQVIIAAPPDKIQYIGPSVKKVLLVLADNNMSYVEDFTRV